MQEDTSLPVKGPVKRNQGASWGGGGASAEGKEVKQQ